MRRLVIGAVAALALALGACAAPAGGDGTNRGTDVGDRPTIVVTTNILGDVVESVVGDAAEVTTLMKPNADPHSFEISAQEAGQLASADLVVSNGLGLEEGLQQHLDRAADAGAEMFVAGDQIDVLGYSVDDLAADGSAGARGDDGGDRATGADARASTPDPHFWTDPGRVVVVVDALLSRLRDIDGIDSAVVSAGAERYRADLLALDADMAAAFADLPAERRALVTNHHVFGYLADRYDLRVIGAAIPGGTTLASPSAADLDELATAIADSGVPTLFAESSQPDRLVQVLASEAGVDVRVDELFTESLTESGQGADTYLAMMRTNTERIVRGLDS